MRRALLALAALALPLAALPGRADPAPGDLASANVSLVAHVPTGTGVGGVFAGDHYFQTSARPGFYLGGGLGTGGLLVFDISNPELPTPVGALPLPHAQNEDVDVSTKRHLLLISQDRSRPLSTAGNNTIVAGALYTVDISNPSAPLLKGRLDLPGQIATAKDGTPLGGPGHTATCVLDCRYAYLSGSRDRSFWVVDLRDPAAPTIVGKVATPAGADNKSYTPGVVHDAYVDPRGRVWVVGSGGTAVYAPLTDPMHPRLLATTSAADNTRLNQLIHHGALRLDERTTLIGEESFDAADCGRKDHTGPQDGSFQTWRLDLRHKRITPLDSWDADTGANSNSPLGECSSHWFDLNGKKVVADAWYGAGVRFLDVSDPRHVRQVGYYAALDTAAGQAQFVPGHDDLVYVSDYDRGLDVLRIDGGGRGAPTVSVPSTWRPRAVPGLQPHAEFGWVCATRDTLSW